MTTVNAYAIHQIGTRINGEKTNIPASTKASPSIFTTTEAELKKLIALGAARLASREEIAVATVQENVINTITDSAEAASSSVGDERPVSGAKGDPQGNRKAAKVKAEAQEPETPAATPADDDNL
jgi:hypothetical protein